MLPNDISLAIINEKIANFFFENKILIEFYLTINFPEDTYINNKLYYVSFFKTLQNFVYFKSSVKINGCIQLTKHISGLNIYGAKIKDFKHVPYKQLINLKVIQNKEKISAFYI